MIWLSKLFENLKAAAAVVLAGISTKLKNWDLWLADNNTKSNYYYYYAWCYGKAGLCFFPFFFHFRD